MGGTELRLMTRPAIIAGMIASSIPPHASLPRPLSAIFLSLTRTRIRRTVVRVATSFLTVSFGDSGSRHSWQYMNQAEVQSDSQLICSTPAHGVSESLPLRFTLNGNTVHQFDDVRFRFLSTFFDNFQLYA